MSTQKNTLNYLASIIVFIFMKGAILVYDVTNRESFQKIDNWLNELETYSTNHDLIKMLVGNKVCVEFMEEGGGG